MGRNSKCRYCSGFAKDPNMSKVPVKDQLQIHIVKEHRAIAELLGLISVQRIEDKPQPKRSDLNVAELENLTSSRVTCQSCGAKFYVSDIETEDYNVPHCCVACGSPLITIKGGDSHEASTKTEKCICSCGNEHEREGTNAS